MPSVPPPSVPPPATRPTPTHELVLPIEGKPRRGEADRLRLTADGISFEHGRVMHSPLELPLVAVKVAAVDAGPAKPEAQQLGRFAILRRIGPNRVIPRTEGIEGWLWTSTAGTALTNLGGEEAPNVALVFTKPLEEAQLRAAFDPDFVTALAARSPLGSPTVLGVLFRVAEAHAAGTAFRRWGFQSMLTDKEVPPTLRRHLPTDRPADPVVRAASEDARAATSVPPPGFS